jgi:hypothetical protein
MNKRFGNKQLILVFLFLFSVALVQNTTGVTTATTMATAGGNGNGPLAPHMRPGASRRRIKWMGDNPPSLRMHFFGRSRVFMDLKVLLVPAMMNHHNIGVFWGP